jgi:hypothetical protein
VFALAILERHLEVEFAVDLDVVHLEGVADPTLVHRAVEELDRLDRRGIEARPPMPIPVREGVREHAPVRVRGFEREVHVDLVEPMISRVFFSSSASREENQSSPLAFFAAMAKSLLSGAE